MTNFDLISEAINAINNGNGEEAITRLRQFTALNTPKVKGGGKIKIYDWVSKDTIRPAFMGVFHDTENNVAVATDTHVILVSKPDYIDREESAIIAKNGDIIVGRYAAWQCVFAKEDNIEPYEVNRERIAEMLSKMRAERKIDKSVDYIAFNVGGNDRPMYIDPKFCKLLLTLPEGTFYVRRSEYQYSPLQFESADGNYKALIMPIRINDEFIGQDMITPDGKWIY